MLPAVASKRGFADPYVTVTTKGGCYPATLVLDKHVKENVSLVSRGEYREGDAYARLYVAMVLFTLVLEFVEGQNPLPLDAWPV